MSQFHFNRLRHQGYECIILPFVDHKLVIMPSQMNITDVYRKEFDFYLRFIRVDVVDDVEISPG